MTPGNKLIRGAIMINILRNVCRYFKSEERDLKSNFAERKS